MKLNKRLDELSASLKELSKSVDNLIKTVVDCETGRKSRWINVYKANDGDRMNGPVDYGTREDAMKAKSPLVKKFGVIFNYYDTIEVRK